MRGVANLRGRKDESEDGNLDLLCEQFGVKICIEFCCGLLAIIERWVVSCYKSNSGSVPFCFIPLMIGDITLIIFHDLLDAGNGLDLAKSFVGENPVEYVVCCTAAIIAACSFLVQLKLFLMNCFIGPLQRINFFQFLVLIIQDNHV